jgi:hypothetical protein
MNICGYGCGREGKYSPRKGMTKWCCEEFTQQCPALIKRVKITLKNRKLKPFSKEHREKLSIANKGRIVSKETREKISKTKKGILSYIPSEETKRKISISNKGKIVSRETRLKLSILNKGKKLSEETKNKISIGNKDHEVSKKTRQKISKSNKGKIRTDDMKSRMSRVKLGCTYPNKKQTLSIEKIKEIYPLFSKVEEMQYEFDKEEKNIIQFHCKNHKCKNSKENNGWFTPLRIQLYERIRQIESDNGNDGSYFYCSENCKQSCSIYKKSASQIIKEDQERAGIIKPKYYTTEEYNTWRKEVLKRANNKCEYCEKDATHCHHIKPQKLEPFFSLDPDFGLACCEKCHYEKGHKDECGTGKIATEICL